MAAELVGTAYVRIRAITAGLAKDISDGVEKGVKDAGPDVTKSGEGLGADLGEGAAHGLGDSVADGVADALDAPEVHKAAEEGGEAVGRDVSKGVDREHRRRNPFQSMLDAIGRLPIVGAFRDKFADIEPPVIDFDSPEMHRGAFDAGEDTADSFSRGFDRGRRRRNPFRTLINAFRRIIPDFNRRAERAGEEAGDKFTEGVERSHKRRNPFTFLGDTLASLQLTGPLKWLSLFSPAILQPIVGTIVAMIGLVTQALGFVVTAAAGAGVALAGIAAVALPGLGVLFAAFKTNTKRLEQFKKKAKDLLKPWQQIGIAAQERIFPGLESLLEAVQAFIGPMTVFARELGGIISEFARFVGEILTADESLEAFGTILEESLKFFESITRAAEFFIDMLLPFFAAAAPLAVRFADSLGDMLGHLNHIVQLKSGTGELADTFETWYDRFALLAGIIGDVFSALWGILSIAAETGTPFFDKVAEAADRFSAWVSSAEGENTIKQFFDDIYPVLDELWRLLGNVIDLIVKPAVGDGGAQMFERLAGALDFLNDVLEDPNTERVVPYLLGVLGAITLLSALSGPMKLIGNGLTGIATGLEGIAKFSGGAAKGLWSVAQAIGGISLSLGKSLGTIAIFLVTNPVGLILLAIAEGVLAVYIAFQNWDTIIEFLKGAWEWFTKLALPVQIVVGAFAAFVVLFTPLGQMASVIFGITAALKNWDKIAEFVDRLWDSIYQFFTRLPELATVALDALVEFVKKLPETLAPIGETILTFFQELPGKMKEALLTGLENLPGLIVDALGALGNLGLTLIGLIADGLIAAAPIIGEWFIRLPFMIIDWMWTATANIVELGLNIVQWIVKGLAEAIPEILEWFVRLPWEIATLVRKGLIEFVKLGWRMIVSFVTGLFDERDRIFDFFHDLPLNILRAIAALAEFLFNFGKGLIIGMWRGLLAVWPQVQSFFAELPGKIIRFLSGAGGFLVDIGARLLNGLWEGMQEVWGSINEFFFGLPNAIAGWFKKLPGLVVKALSKFVEVVIDFFVGLYEDLVGASIIPDMIMDIVWWFAKLPLLIVDVLVDLVTTLIGFFVDLAVQLVAALPGAFATLWDWFTKLPQVLFDLIVLGLQTILNIGGWLVSNILAGIVAIAQTLWDWFTALPQAILDLLIVGAQAIIDIGGKILGWIVEGLETLGQTLWDWFTELPGAILDLLGTVAQGIKDIGGAILGWIVDGLGAAWHFVTDYITNFPGNFVAGMEVIIDKIKGIGGTILDWIVQGIGAAWHFVTDWITNFPTNFLTGMDAIIDKVKELGGTILGWIWDAFENAFKFTGVIGKWIKDLPGKLVTAFTGISEDIIGLGKKIIEWIVEGIKDAPGAIVDAVESLLPGWVKSALGKVFGFLELGGIVPGSPSGTPYILGENNRAEAVIPLTRPTRALQIMSQAGLTSLAIQAQQDTSVQTQGDVYNINVTGQADPERTAISFVRELRAEQWRMGKAS